MTSFMEFMLGALLQQLLHTVNAVGIVDHNSSNEASVICFKNFLNQTCLIFFQQVVLSCLDSGGLNPWIL